MTKRLAELKRWAAARKLFYQKGQRSGLWYCYHPKCSESSLEALLETIKQKIEPTNHETVSRIN